MFFFFFYVLDVNKNKFYWNIWFYLIVKKLFFYLIVKLWLLLQSGTVHLLIVSRILSCIFEGDDILHRWRVILVFYCLEFYYYYYYFCNWGFWKTLWRRLSLVISFYYCFRPINILRVFHVEKTRRLCENVVSALFWRVIHVQCL